jgi:hypothetical protein
VITTDYAVRDTLIERTDIDIIAPDTVDMFSKVSQSTDLLSATSTVDWLQRAASQFEVILSTDRRWQTLLYFSSADALTSSLRMPELAFETITATLLNNVGNRADLDPPGPVSLSRQLTSWLGITYDQLSSITGVSRAAFFYWRRPGATPRNDSIRQIERLYALISLLTKRFGVEGARSWLHSGEHPMWDQLLVGDLTTVEDAARAQLFRHKPGRTANNLSLDEVDLDLPAQAISGNLGSQRAKRQPTRGRLKSE